MVGGLGELSIEQLASTLRVGQRWVSRLLNLHGNASCRIHATGANM